MKVLNILIRRCVLIARFEETVSFTKISFRKGKVTF